MNDLIANGTDAGRRPTGAAASGRSAAMAMNGMAATSHVLATEVAVDTLRRGGSAIDAAIAANAMLSFAEPFMCGPGGDLFATVWDPESRELCGLNGSGRAPKDLSYKKLMSALGPGVKQMPFQGPWPVTVPGAIDAWFMLHERFGRLPIADLLAPTIAYADAGVPTPEIIAADWQGLVEMHRSANVATGLLDNFIATYAPAPAKGAVFRNPDLARFFERIAADGPDYFYRGEAAELIARSMQSYGSPLAVADLDGHRGTWVDPVSTDYRGYDVYELPPNGQGIAALQILNIVEDFDLRALGRGNPDFWHVMIEAKKLSFEDRARHYADLDFMQVPVEQLIAKDYAAAQRARIDMRQAMRSAASPIELTRGSDTVYLTTADKDGMMVSFIQSLFTGFGSLIVPDGLGFALQNRGACFSLEPGHPNCYAPAKRPFHTIIPGFVMKGSEPVLAFGVMGGDMQPQGHVQVLINMIDFGLDPQAAGDAARWRHDGSSGPGHTMADGGQVVLEPGVSADVVNELIARGHCVELDRSGFGGYQAIMRNPATGVLTGATEMRKDGSASGY